MKIAVWKTGHPIADRVADALAEGLNAKTFYTQSGYKSADAHIGYGILRGSEAIFKRSAAENVPWFNVDKGYFKSGHYDGYYRISLRGTQQTDLTAIAPDYKRFEQLGIKLEYAKPIDENAHTLICPPTDHVCRFFGINRLEWLKKASLKASDSRIIMREKSNHIPLQEHLTNCLRVITFNSSVGWEALRQGIPIYSDPNHSIVGAYQKSIAKPLHLDYKSISELFAIMGVVQMTLDEIKSGALCPLLHRLSALSGLIPEKQYAAM